MSRPKGSKNKKTANWKKINKNLTKIVGKIAPTKKFSLAKRIKKDVVPEPDQVVDVVEHSSEFNFDKLSNDWGIKPITEEDIKEELHQMDGYKTYEKFGIW
jgi:hypothetical protein